MGFDDGRLILNHEDGVYYAGDTVHGVLEFQQEKPKTFRGIYVKARGYAHTHWTTSHTRRGADGKSHSYTVSHDGNEDYFSSTQYLIGAPSGEQNLAPGFHKFPFQIPLPAHCPSSFEGDYGHVRYVVCVVVDRAFKFDQEKEITIALIAPVDLNADPLLRNPVCSELEESYCCWCMSSGNVKTCIRLPSSGLVPGQSFDVELACDNRSNVAMTKIKLAIKQHSHFIAHSAPGERSGASPTIVEVKKGPIPANTSRSWTVTMEVPSDTQPSGLANCHIISMGYVFKVTVVAEGCHSNAESEDALCIGTIPMRDGSLNAPPPRDGGDNVSYQDRDTNPLIPQNSSKNNAHFPMPSQPFPGSNQPYPGPNQPYPGANQPYPGANQPYPGANQPYPGANQPYSGANQPYPGANQPFSEANQPFPGANQQFPGANQPYPGANQPYSGVNQPFPGSNHYPSGCNQNPTAPYEAQSLPYSNKKEQEATASYPNAPPASAATPGAAASHPPSYWSVTQGAAPYPAAAAVGAPSSLPPHMSASGAVHAPSTPSTPAAQPSSFE